MNKHIITKLLALAFACCFHSSQAAVISVKLPGDSLNYTTTVGSQFDAGIYIDSVPDFGGFDFNLTYDSTKQSLLSLTSASVFGADGTEVFGNSLTSPGVFHFAETISATSPTAITAGLNITAPTLLGTVHFQALNTAVNSLLSIGVNGTNPIWITFDGTPNPQNTSIQGAFVTINAAPVPLPASFWLMGTGLLGFAANRWSQLKQKLS